MEKELAYQQPPMNESGTLPNTTSLPADADQK